MKAKRWLLAFFLTCLLGAAVFAGFNVLVDPFGVFGDPVFHWYSFDMTENPRTAKIAYLEKHHTSYDSYVIGSSKASSIPVETLNTYMDASFYNMTWYGGNLWDEQRTISYLISQYTVKNIVLTVEPQIALTYHAQSDDLKQEMHCLVSGAFSGTFYGRYLFCNPAYSFDKIKAYREQTFLQDPSAVYIAETGVYNKQRRDAMPMNDLASYLAEEAGPFSMEVVDRPLPYISQSVAAIAEIKALCDKNNVSLTVICLPLSDEEVSSFLQSDVDALRTGIAQVTDYWDFLGCEQISNDPRYFYDSEHFRNCVGQMVLARIFDDSTVYTPDGFGTLVTADTVAQHICKEPAQSTQDYIATVPILMYHSFTNGAVASAYDVTAERFEEQLQALQEAGYHAVSPRDLEAYVKHGTALPEKPFVITMDDGYESNLTIAAPILEKYGDCATIAVIGVSIGKQTYKDSDTPITPHFSLEQAQPWCERGVISLATHSYDMHQVDTLDGESCRKGVLQLPDETETAYAGALEADFTRSLTEMKEATGTQVSVVAYPYGFHSEISEIVLHSLGISITMTSDPGINELVKGAPQSLYLLRRNDISQDMTGEELVAMLDQYHTEEA